MIQIKLDTKAQIDRLMEAVPIYRLSCNMESEAAKVAYVGMMFVWSDFEVDFEVSVIFKRRNELIAGVLVVCNVMEAAGTGFDKIMEEYASADEAYKPYISTSVPGGSKGPEIHTGRLLDIFIKK